MKAKWKNFCANSKLSRERWRVDIAFDFREEIAAGLAPREIAASFSEAIPYRVAIAIGFTILYVVLDRSVVFFQMWEGISAWYPPAGLALALLVGLDLAYAPLLLIAGMIAACVNYPLSAFSVGILGRQLRRRDRIHGRRLHFAPSPRKHRFPFPQGCESVCDGGAGGFILCCGHRFGSLRLGWNASASRLSQSSIELVGRRCSCADLPDAVSAHSFHSLAAAASFSERSGIFTNWFGAIHSSGERLSLSPAQLKVARKAPASFFHCGLCSVGTW